MSILQQGIVPTSAGGYEIANSLRFNDNDSAYLSRTPSSTGNQQTWTWSAWVKRGNLGTEQSVSICVQWSNIFNIYFRSDDKLSWDVEYGSTRIIAYTDRVFRDTSGWYHIVATLDTTNSTASERLKIWVNGELQTFPNYAYGSGYIAQNSSLIINSTTRSHNIGRRGDNPVGQYLDGYLAEVNFIDGQALDPSNFGETGDYGEWKPIRYTGTYGTNGFYLDFENSGSLGADVSGNSNNWTPNNLAATDQMLDSPTNNFCTLNPLEKASSVTLSEGNLRAYPTTDYDGIRATIGQTTGKWYFEAAVYVVTGNVDDVGIGITGDDTALTNMYAVSPAVWAVGGSILKNNAVVQSGLGSFAVGDIIGVALNLDSGTVQFYKNNTAYGSAETLPTNSAEWLPSVYGANTRNQYLNFGQDSSFAGNKTAQGNADGNGYGDFYYTPPTGYLALCTQNLPDPTVIPSEHFNTVIWSGNSSTQSITGVGFAPDLPWIKCRNSAQSHRLNDKVRGVAKTLFSDTTSAEATDETNGLTSFDSDGFTLGSSGAYNQSGRTYVAWNWKANGAGVSNTDGTITSTVSANTSAGFSIVSYTGTGVDDATVGHGLSKAPEMVIIKNRIDALHWFVHHQYHGATPEYRYRLLLNTTGARTYDTGWLEANPTATVFQLGTSGYTNGVSDDMIAYCFHSVEGYSKVGSYTGNGSTDGTFVYTGFRPAYVMVKRTNATQNWVVVDSGRSPDNLANEGLYANETNAEMDITTFGASDLLSNGFKMRQSNTNSNGSGDTYIYIAFAENPFKHTNAR